MELPENSIDQVWTVSCALWKNKFFRQGRLTVNREFVVFASPMMSPSEMTIDLNEIERLEQKHDVFFFFSFLF
jgi:hypothetical protein